MAPHDFEWSKLASSLLRSPIRSISMPAQEKKKRGEDIAMLAGGMPHPTLFPMVGLTVDNVPIEHNVAGGAGARRRSSSSSGARPRRRRPTCSGAAVHVGLRLRAAARVAQAAAAARASRPAARADAARAWDVALSVGNTDALLKTPSC